MFKEGDIAISGQLIPHLIIEVKNPDRIVYNIYATRFISSLYSFSKKQNYVSRSSYTNNGLASKKTYNLNNLVSKVEKLSGLNKDYCLFITDIFNIGNKRINQYTITANTKAMSSTKFLTAKTIRTEDLDFNNKIFNLNQFVLQSASSYREHSLLREIESKQYRLFQNLNNGAY